MTDAEVVRSRLASLRRNARRLHGIVAMGRERFLSDDDLQLRAERCLQLALQAVLDIGMHVIADRSLERPTGYEGVIPALGKERILSAELVERMTGVAGLRNILVHDYLAVDHGILFGDLTAGLADFEAFAAAIEALLSADKP
jgi:uncharacterized protein YutE (UPF0331/DUF86 family)